jgi:AraC-like DNA-binding protein
MLGGCPGWVQHRAVMGGRTIAAIAAWYIHFGVTRGLSFEELLAVSELSPDDFADLDRMIPDVALMRLWPFLADRLPGVVVPLELAKSFDSSKLGIAGRILLASENARHSLTQNSRFQKLVDSTIEVSLVEDGGLAVYTLRHRDDVHALGLPIELMMAMSVLVASAGLGERMPLEAVTFSHAPRYPVSAYEQFFGTEVSFSAKADSLRVAAHHLDRPFATLDPQLSRYLEAQAGQMVASLPPSAPPFVAEVTKVVVQELPRGPIDQASVARKLAVSTRTLQRRLAEANTSFQDVLEEVRHAVAEQLLRDRQNTIIDVAFSLGYSDAPSFYRAFKRWTQKTPQQWRAAQ